MDKHSQKKQKGVNILELWDAGRGGYHSPVRTKYKDWRQMYDVQQTNKPYQDFSTRGFSTQEIQDLYLPGTQWLTKYPTRTIQDYYNLKSNITNKAANIFKTNWLYKSF